jgi:Flp pilus assembly protein TadD
MEDTFALAEFKHGVALLRNGRPGEAVEYFRRAVEGEKHNPYYLSFFGVSVGRSLRRWDTALELCQRALRLKRNEVQLYLNLAEIYVSAGRREDAVLTLDTALRYCGSDARVRRARSRLGKRGSAVLPFLARQHFLNRNLGKLRHSVLKQLRKSKES